MWTTIAEGTSIDNIEILRDKEVHRGDKVRFEMKLRFPVAHAFDLPGAETVMRYALPSGFTVTDVYSPDNKYNVIMEAQYNGSNNVGNRIGARIGIAPILAGLIAFIAQHWLAISLITIGIAFSLGYLIESIKIKSEDIVTTKIATLAAITIGVLGVVYFISKAGIKVPGVEVGGK